MTECLFLQKASMFHSLHFLNHLEKTLLAHEFLKNIQFLHHLDHMGHMDLFHSLPLIHLESRHHLNLH